MPQLVETPREESVALKDALVGASLCVVFAEGDAIAALREAGSGSLPLEPPYSLSDEDCYLILPDDIGTEIVDIMRDGDLELMHESMADGLIACGQVAPAGKGRMSLEVEQAAVPMELLRAGLPYAAEVPLQGGSDDPVHAVNTLGHVQCTMLSALLDDDGLDAMLKRPEYVGASWRVPTSAHQLPGIDPTFAWTRHAPDGSLGVELALYQEDEELIVLLRPVRLTQ